MSFTDQLPLDCYVAAADQFRPVVGRGLAEEARLRVPGSVWPVLHPAPVGLPGEQEPDGFAESAGEVGDGGVGGDDQVEIGDEGGGCGEVGVVGAAVLGAEVGWDDS